MHLKSFISHSFHESFILRLDNILNNEMIKTKDQAIVQLSQERDNLEKLYLKYRNTISELGSLINQYHDEQTRVRKKLRMIQMKRNSTTQSR